MFVELGFEMTYFYLKVYVELADAMTYNEYAVRGLGPGAKGSTFSLGGLLRARARGLL